MVSDAALWIVVGSYFCTSVAGAYHRFSFYVLPKFIVFFRLYNMVSQKYQFVQVVHSVSYKLYNMVLRKYQFVKVVHTVSYKL